MRNFKAVWSVGSAMLILSGAAMAQGGLPTGVTFGGTIDKNCTLGDTPATNCKIIAGGDNGFVQRQFIAGGKTFIQTILADSKNGFASEDFVQLQSQGSQQGVASKLSIKDSTGAFDTTSSIMAGWAHTSGLAGKTSATIDLNITDAGTTGQFNGFKSGFNVTTEFDGANATTPNKIGFLKVTQVAELGTATDKQSFETVIRPAKAASPAIAPGTTFRLVGDVGTGTTWAAGDMIQATWVGQNIAAVGAFSTESVQNVSVAQPTATFATSLTNPAPQNWSSATQVGSTMVSEFGTAPTF